MPGAPFLSDVAAAAQGIQKVPPFLRFLYKALNTVRSTHQESANRARFSYAARLAVLSAPSRVI